MGSGRSCSLAASARTSVRGCPGPTRSTRWASRSSSTGRARWSTASSSSGPTSCGPASHRPCWGSARTRRSSRGRSPERRTPAESRGRARLRGVQVFRIVTAYSRRGSFPSSISWTARISKPAANRSISARSKKWTAEFAHLPLIVAVIDADPVVGVGGVPGRVHEQTTGPSTRHTSAVSRSISAVVRAMHRSMWAYTASKPAVGRGRGRRTSAATVVIPGSVLRRPPRP